MWGKNLDSDGRETKKEERGRGAFRGRECSGGQGWTFFKKEEEWNELKGRTPATTQEVSPVLVQTALLCLPTLLQVLRELKIL